MGSRSSVPPSPNKESNIPPPPNELAESVAIFTRVEVISALKSEKPGSALLLAVEDPANPNKLKSLQFADKEYLAKLAETSPENFEIFNEFLNFLNKGAGISIEDIRKLDELAIQIAKKSIEGAKPKEIMDLKTKYDEKRDKIADNIEKAILNGLECMSKYRTLALKKHEMARFGPVANRKYEEKVEQRDPSERDRASWGYTHINIEDSIGKLAAIFLQKGNPLMRYHAKLKFLSMIQLAIQANKESASESNKGLSFLVDVVLDRFTYYHEGEDRGATFEMFLNTKHDPENFGVTGYELSDTQAKKEDFVQSRKLNLRRIQIKNQDDTTDFAPFLFESRKKSLEDVVDKTVRHCKSADEHNDHNGARLTFGKYEHAREAERTFVKILKDIYERTLVQAQNRALETGDDAEFERISKKLESKRECVLIEWKERVQTGTDDKGNPIYDFIRFKSTNTDDAFERIQDSLIEGKHEGHSAGSSEDFKVRKYILKYNHPDGDTYIYEIQIMLFDGYVDKDYRKGASTAEYHKNRLHKDKGGIMETNFAPKYYPGSNLEAECAKGISSIRASHREILAPEHTKATKAKERELRKKERELRERERELDDREKLIRRKEEAMLTPTSSDAKKVGKKKKSKNGNGKRK